MTAREVDAAGEADEGRTLQPDPSAQPDGYSPGQPDQEPRGPMGAELGATARHAASAPSSAVRGVLPLWRNRDYAAWWVSSLISSLGSAMSQLAYPLLMLYETGSVARAGVVGACLNIGGLSTTLLGGVLADRYSRRRLTITADLIQAFAVGSVVAAVSQGYVNVVHIGAVALIQGMCNGVGGAAMTPVLKRIVSPEQFPALSASKQGREMISRLAGPPLGGALFSLAKWVPFLADAISFLVSALGVALIRRPLGPDAADRADHPSPWQGVREGFAYIRTSVYLRFIILWSALTSALLGGVVLLVIALLKQRGGSPTTVGAVTAVAAIGGLGGALAAPVLLKHVRSRTMVLAASWIIAPATVGIAAAPGPWQIGAISGFLVFLIVPLTVLLESYQLRIVPDALMGRVSSALSFGTSGLLWTAPVTAGVLADSFGVPTAMIVLSGVFAALALWSTLSPAVRLLDEPDEEPH
ncbi:MFS transporter [Actinocrinis puniceicyclus]|uniref:MFS transporter n=1 Tax=Actinocrinis puniceicyclus TaxID=977794 RepID=A0A8J8BG88_9ACTN|nr:MFS transporter [Actinocrinis puniceicyclus]MBS2965514.1 MFS transporter [Actinocrinis puniceicyclus]